MIATAAASRHPEIQRLLNQALDDQKSSWNRGERTPVEDYLARDPALRDDAEAILDMIYQEYVLRLERGETPEHQEFFARFPDHADSLMLQFGVDAAITPTTRFLNEHNPLDADAREPIEVIAGYEIIALLGRGGMGIVYKAREQRLCRIVALKTIAEGRYATPDQLDRFQAEARAIARLRHPNIIAIHAIGEHDNRPYLSLEFAEGGSLAQRLAEKPMAPREAAALVESLARAVHAAHQAGVVHRDLKPSNVLLTADAVPKVSDFGLAKLLDSDSGRTLSGQVMGTPSYMAPEQAEGRSKQVGPAADTYALGAILYHALTGRAPFLGESAMETLKLVTSTEVVAPHLLRPDVPRDLETICLKCLDKEPSRRYPAAEALAEDLRRFLENRPITARPMGPAGRLSRWTRRNPWIAGLSASSAAILIIGIVVSSVLMVRAMRAEREALSSAATAEAERGRAESEAEIARAVNEFLNKDLLAQASSEDQATLDIKADPDITIRILLDRAAGRIQGKFADKPRVEASIRRTIGETYTKLGLIPAAKLHLERALELYRKALGTANTATLETMRALGELYIGSENPSKAETLLIEARKGLEQLRGAEHPDTLSTSMTLAQVYQAQGKLDLAEPMMVDALEGFRRVCGNDHTETLEAANNLAMLYQSRGNLEDAERLQVEARDGFRRLRGPAHPLTLTASHNLGQIRYNQDRWLDAERIFRDVLQARSEVLGPDHPQTLLIKYDLAMAYARQRQWALAEKMQKEVLEGQRRSLGMDHRAVFNTMVTLAVFCNSQNKLGEAERWLTEAMAGSEKTFGAKDPDTLWIMTSLGGLYQNQNRLEEAEKLLERTVAAMRETLGPDHTETLVAIGNLAAIYGVQNNADKAQHLLAEVLKVRRKNGEDHLDTLRTKKSLASCYLALGRASEAEALLIAVRSGMIKKLAADHPETLGAIHELANCYRIHRKFEKAESLCREVLPQRERVLGFEHADTLGTRDLLGVVQTLGEDYSKAVEVLRECLKLREKAWPDHWSRFNTESLLGGCLTGQKNFEEAESHLLSAYIGLKCREKTLAPAFKHFLSEAAERLARLYDAWGKKDEADAWRRNPPPVPAAKKLPSEPFARL